MEREKGEPILSFKSRSLSLFNDHAKRKLIKYKKKKKKVFES